MKKIRNIFGFLLVFCIFAVGAELMAEEDYSVGPTLKDFAIAREGDGHKISFAFFNVKGGLAGANFTIGCQIYRDGDLINEIIQRGQLDVAKVAQIISGGPIESGSFETIIPVIKERELKSGDKIKYFILLTDKTGRKSNVVVYEFVFVEKYMI